jgi:hypothetical protein
MQPDMSSGCDIPQHFASKGWSAGKSGVQRPCCQGTVEVERYRTGWSWNIYSPTGKRLGHGLAPTRKVAMVNAEKWIAHRTPH